MFGELYVMPKMYYCLFECDSSKWTGIEMQRMFGLCLSPMTPYQNRAAELSGDSTSLKTGSLCSYSR